MNVSHTGRCLIAALVLLALPFHGVYADDFDSWNESGFQSHPVRNKPGFHAVERLGITVGGDVISKVTRADGTFREISAGGLYQAGLGALYRWDAIPFSAELTINYHVNSDYNGNDNASFRRNPLEALVYFNGMDRFRIGAGMRYVYAARAISVLNGVTERIAFANARGSIVEIGYEVTPYGWINLRYVKEHYTIAAYSTTATISVPPNTAPYDGSHYGFFISYEY
ncbi:hypothetical protein [Sideroxydans lithotrophicus]|uniref:Outer membrane protein beta-barrel domain-containing protein n=1 Tax=Sideroxydans lithotrophicus (strain ES-1) TaxID=580332 RepID=D5CTT1_SIDLE|nr:hypothetical protein [Sideroxydans lithotrophicus]ADE12243.1 hypothetical protein Slit_2015 [Sideroxydans lithotrophicus ES-1]